MNTDFLIHEMANTYHGKRGEYLSSHLLGDFRENPKYYKQKVDGQVKDVDQTAYIEGRAVHTRILEGQQIFNDTYIVGGGPINKTTGKPYGTDSKAYKEWASDSNHDKSLQVFKSTIPFSGLNQSIRIWHFICIYSHRTTPSATPTDNKSIASECWETVSFRDLTSSPWVSVNSSLVCSDAHSL